MYKSGYVVAVLANGSVLNEDGSNRVMLPFGQEYKVRLINRNYERCCADLIINGDKISRFILDAGETSDIERYVDGSLYSGSRFKFTSLHDSKVKDPSSFENGLVEVLFYKEIKKKEPIVIKEEHHHYHDHWDWKPIPTYPIYPQYPNPVYYRDGMVLGDNAMNSSGQAGGTSYMMNCNSIATSAFSGQEGATVRGSSSDQKFREVSGLEFDSTPVIIKLKIVNGDLQMHTKYCSGCGRKRNHSDKFCGNCGVRY